MRATRGQRRQGAWGASVVLLATLAGTLAETTGARGEGEAGVAQTPAASPESETTLGDEDLDRLLAPLRDDSADTRRAATVALSALGPEAVDAVARKLAAFRSASDEGASSLLHAARDRGGKDAAPDLVEWLIGQRPAGAQGRALATICLLRALAHAGTPKSVKQLLTAASDLAGALRPEIGRLVRGLGERAVPALIESRRDPNPEVRSWGAGLLASLVKHAPDDALRTKDDAVLCGVLRAYGEVSDMTALPEILALANSDRSPVRSAARQSVLAYGQDALWRLREAYAVLLGEAAPEGVTAANLAARLFDAYDRYRLRDELGLVDRGLELDRAGKAAEAVAVFDEVLAREPLLDRRREMAHAYAERAAALESSDPAAARATLRKALRLDESGPNAAHLRSELRRLEGEAQVAAGMSDTSPFEQALALDPSNRAARDDLQRLRPSLETGRAHVGRLAAAAVVLLLAVAGVVVLGGRATGRRA